MSNYYNRQWRLPNSWNGTESNVNKQSNYSMDFGVSRKISLGSSVDLGINSSISLWINMPNTPTIYIPLGEDSYLADYLMYISSTLIYIVIGNVYKTYTHSFNTNEWYNIVIVRQGDSIEVFKNNTSLGTQTGFGTSVTTKIDTIGAKTSGSNPFVGLIDGVAFFNYALSQSQITTLYGSSSTGIGNPMSLSPKPVAMYNLGDKSVFNSSSYLIPNASLKDYVFSFDGSDDYINSGSASYLNGLSNFTFSSWVNISTLGTYDVIASDWSYSATASSNKGHFTAGLGTNDGSAAKIRIFIKNAGADGGISMIITDDYILNTGKWYHVLLTYNSGTVVIYINGVSYAVTNFGTIPTSLTSENSDLYIGKWQNVGRFFDGSISNVQIFNTALPATGSNSVETLYNNGSPLTSMSGFTSLQGWWKLDASATYDSSTTTWSIPDDSSNSNTGTSSGMTQANLVQSDLSFTSGYSPYALDFDGANDYIDCGNDSSLSITSTITLSAWVKPTTAITSQNFPMFIAKGLNSDYMLFSNSSTGTARLRLGSSFLIDSTSTISTNVWTHIVGTYDGSNLKIYFNGSLDNTVSQTGAIPSTSASLQIAAPQGGSEKFTGSMSNVSIWNAALTSSQVKEIYAEGVPQNLLNHSAVSSLVSWWQLGSNSSFSTNWTVLDEVTASGNNGTSSNMTESDIVDGVGSYANGLSSGMGGDEVIGSAPFSDSNSLSINMDALDRVEDTPS